MLYADRGFHAIERKQKVRSVLRIGVFAHVLGSNRRYLLHDRFDDLHFDSCRGYGGEANEDYRHVNALLFEFVVVADDVSSTRWIGEENSKAWRIAKSVCDFLGPLESSGCFGDLLKFDKGEFGEDLDFFDDAVAGHELGHGCFVVVLGDSS